MVQLPAIDMEQTGRRIRQLCVIHGYSVRDLQKYLFINCPQSIYNWFHGKTLPSLDHLFALSMMLHVPMNWLVVEKPAAGTRWQIRRFVRHPQIRRVDAYRRRAAGICARR